MAINRLLVACKASWESSILKPNLHYERDLTTNFSFKATPRGPAHPTLNTQELQAIKYNEQHNISYQQAHLVRQVIYMMVVTNKWYSYPRVTTIQIDVHPIGENSINMPYTFHTQFTYGPGPYISRGLCRQPFASPHKDETCPYTREKSWQPKTDWPDRHLGSPHSPSFMIALE
jgi:hypothetical protein